MTRAQPFRLRIATPRPASLYVMPHDSADFDDAEPLLFPRGLDLVVEIQRDGWCEALLPGPCAMGKAFIGGEFRTVLLPLATLKKATVDEILTPDHYARRFCLRAIKDATLEADRRDAAVMNRLTTAARWYGCKATQAFKYASNVYGYGAGIE